MTKGSLTQLAFQIVQPPNTGLRSDNPPDNPGALLNNMISNVILIIFAISAIAVIFMFLWGAFEWIISGGDKDKIGAARKRITAALIGLTILALSFFIIKLVGTIIGFDPLGQLTIPNIANPTTTTIGR